MLQNVGYRVLTANDGAVGVAVYVQHAADIAVVLTDLMMPVIAGQSMILRSLQLIRW